MDPVRPEESKRVAVGGGEEGIEFGGSKNRWRNFMGMGEKGQRLPADHRVFLNRLRGNLALSEADWRVKCCYDGSI